MRRPIVFSILTVAAVLTGALVVAAPAQAHGYVSSPPSRQALCAQGRVTNCGQIQYEPQSVEGPKGLRSCSGGNSRFSVLDNESKGWPATSVGSSVTFNWVLTARHATSTWEYYIGGSRIAYFNDGGRQPGATVSHPVSLAGFSGRQKVLAIWNIADTANAFYACVDVQIGGGPNPTPTPTVDPTSNPTTPPPTGGTWAAGTAYQTGSEVTYGGTTYRCLQPHTAIPGWEPPYVPALWQRV
ncbi:lytic polysaccharide monooxygenase [Micromonospora sonneratiae]|uniref:Lytic polysaccharide monooxygenase n=1 Tax=Micromonospora sonneratiae TaxID=1184706 RepID=A0ABW3Y8M4_9ACTN